MYKSTVKEVLNKNKVNKVNEIFSLVIVIDSYCKTICPIVSMIIQIS